MEKQMNPMNTKANFLGRTQAGASLFILLTVLLASAAPVALAWDAGTESRRHNEGTGGEQAITIFDTRPYWARSTGLTTSGRVADCPAGYTNTGLTCYRGPDTYAKGCTTIFKKYECKAGY